MTIIKLTQVLDIIQYYYSGLQSQYPSQNTILQQQNIAQGQTSAQQTTGGLLNQIGSYLGMSQNQTQTAQNQLGAITLQNALNANINSTQNTGYYSSTSNYQEQTIELYLPIDSINYMTKNQSGTKIYLKTMYDGNQVLNVKENPEQILKMIHSTKFNSKMDDLLK